MTSAAFHLWRYKETNRLKGLPSPHTARYFGDCNYCSRYSLQDVDVSKAVTSDLEFTSPFKLTAKDSCTVTALVGYFDTSFGALHNKVLPTSWCREPSSAPRNKTSMQTRPFTVGILSFCVRRCSFRRDRPLLRRTGSKLYSFYTNHLIWHKVNLLCKVVES